MDDDCKYNWDEMVKQLFHINEHRINNTGWMMKWRWKGGVERKAKLLGECGMFLIYIFLHQQWKQCLEFALAKLREICKYLAGACNSNSHARGLLSAKTRQGNQHNEASRLRKCIKKSTVLSLAWNAKKSLCKLNSLQCCQKTTTSLWKLKRKGNWKNGIAATG